MLPTASQGLDNVAVLKSVCKFAQEIPCADAISEVSACWRGAAACASCCDTGSRQALAFPTPCPQVLTNAFRNAESIGRPGAAFVSLPQDILVGGWGPATVHFSFCCIW